jgi:flavin reductase (DIM6/NTAB) family NADH-FMN oxidoreductase RutF
MGTDFEPIRMLDNFYQTSAFYPMPVVLITTVSESGQTNIGPYSLCFPYIIADQGKHAMMLVAREDSNTAMNIKRTKVCAINFIEDDKKFLENAVLLGYPGDTTEEKMKDSIFTLLPSMRENKDPNVQYPEIIEEAFQVMECTWDDSYDRCLCEGGDNFCLKIDNILLKKKFREAIIRGMDAKDFPRMPIDYGFRDNIYFWFTKGEKPYKVRIPESKGTSANTVFYAAKRFDPEIDWTMEACEKIAAVPRVFLKRVISGVVDAAKEEGITVITPEFMDKVRDKRSQEKES